jgi:hypothetical protein
VLDRDVTVDARDAVQDAHPAAQPPDDRLDDHHVAGWTRRCGRARCRRKTGYGRGSRVWQNHDRADLRIASVRMVGGSTRCLRGAPVPLVEATFDPDDPAVGLEFGDAIDEQERIPRGRIR